MPERWLDFDLGGGTGLEVAAGRLLAALVAGAAIALVCRRSIRRPPAAAFPLMVALVLLPALVAMTTIVIADNIARAFGLVGALSIVRFRTVVEDTRDTVFIVFAVAAGMAIGAADLGVAAVGVVLVGLAALALDRWCRPADDAPVALAVEVRLGVGHDPHVLVAPVLGRHARSVRFVGLETARLGAAADVHYEVLAPPDAATRLAAELGALDGVQSFRILESRGRS